MDGQVTICDGFSENPTNMPFLDISKDKPLKRRNRVGTSVNSRVLAVRRLEIWHGFLVIQFAKWREAKVRTGWRQGGDKLKSK